MKTMKTIALLRLHVADRNDDCQLPWEADYALQNACSLRLLRQSKCPLRFRPPVSLRDDIKTVCEGAFKQLITRLRR